MLHIQMNAHMLVVMYYTGKCIECTQANVVQVHATVLNATRCVVSDGTDKDLGGLNVLLLFYCMVSTVILYICLAWSTLLT